MTPNKLPPLPESNDDDLPVPIAYGMRRKGEISVISVVPNKVHAKPATSETYLREFEEVALFTAEQLHAAREQAFHDGQCEALRQSQSLPSGAVADPEAECDAFEEWAESGGFNMETHPLHYLFLDDKTKAARAGWKAALRYSALKADAREKGEAVGYFAADPAMGEFTRHDTLEAALADAMTMLESASDEAADYGWADDPPQIVYGAIIGECAEHSRVPAPRETGFTELVTYRLTQPAQASEKADFWALERGCAALLGGSTWAVMPADQKREARETLAAALATSSQETASE